MDARGQRLDVANTIYYRRRKGTVALLEQLAADVTGYEARVIEFFRRLGRTRHGLDPEIGYPADSADPAAARRLQHSENLTGLLTGTPAGGCADLRDPLGASMTGSAFDEYHHRADVRRGARRRSAGTASARSASSCGGRWRCGSTGRRRCRSAAAPATTAPTRPAGRSRCSRHRLAARTTTARAGCRSPPGSCPCRSPRLMWEAIAGAGAPVPGPQAYPDPAATLWPGSLAVRATGAGDPLDLAQVRVWPEVGRFEVLSGPADVEAGYHYGLFSRIGAGPYDRRRLGVPVAADPQPVQRILGGSAISLPDAVAALGARGTVVVTDGLTLPAVAAVGTLAAPIADITIRGDDQQRAVIRTTPGAGPWIFQGAASPGQPGARLRLEGILLSGTDLVLRGRFEEVVLSCCTLDPGTSGDLRTPPEVWDRSVDGRDLSPATVWVEGDVRTLTVDRCITGPIRTRQAA